ncbi:GNAT family N-acetyltransferase [Humibacter ginsenosidimutans]|uniref:GNAT family N-acetyltransferase n=1 Tax=Humibacter ginsenosidimutans TaxID=2599293 RepID=A0A5B8M0V4_9MICO|nr:GNAT family N-acetyltransferase [Humibacter ginsenosidimutans]QDZ13569.1 GNAT family N-acetyltransferase [Humibacter ginsenosidimutans]
MGETDSGDGATAGGDKAEARNATASSNARTSSGSEADATAGIRVIAVADAPWSDVQTVFGTRGDASTCWCQWFKLTNAQMDEAGAAGCQSALREQSQHGAGPGLVAYLDDEPVGWVAVEPRSAYPRLHRTRIVIDGSAEPKDAADVWSVTCFVVRVGFRRRGVASALLDAAVAHAKAGGARVLEGYPIDTSERKASSSDLYHGALVQFEKAGFGVVSRPSAGRAVVSRIL